MILALVLSALAVPPLTGPVVDEAHVLSAADAARLDDLARVALAQGGPQLGFLIIPSLEGEPIEDYSIRVAEKWKLGTAAKDNGLLFVVAVQDHRMRIEVGGGLEGEITDAQSGRIISGTLAPAFRADQYGQGLYEGARQALALAGVNTPGAPVARRTYQPVHLPIAPIALFLLFVFFSRIFGRRRRGIFWGGPWIGGGGFGGGRGGGGGGGWGGGGGGFSGGGSSGSW